MSERPLVIVNPVSAGGRTAIRWPELAARLRERLGEYSVVFTEAAGQATSLAREALLAGRTSLVAVGGDGTLGEVVSGFFRPDGRAIREGASLGIIPTGTGGDFRRTLGLPADPLRAMERLGDEHIKVDVCRLRYHQDDGTLATRFFLNVASFGIGGLVDQKVNQGRKGLGGRISFGLAVLQALATYQNQRVRLRLDDGPAEEHLLFNGVVANGQYFGGGMHIAPLAKLNDGRFDLVLMGDLGRLQALAGLTRVYRGAHLTRPKVSHRQGRHLSAEPVNPDDIILLDVDGEALGRLPAEFDILPQALRITTAL